MSLFSLPKRDDCVLVEFPEVFAREAIKEFEVESLKWLEDNMYGVVVFDFSKCQKFHSSGFSAVAKFKMNLKKCGIHFFSINLTKDVKATVLQGGVEGVFSICSGFEEIQSRIGVKNKTKNIIEPEFLNLILEGVGFAYTTLFDEEPIRGKAFLRAGATMPGLGVLAVVNLYENDLIGVIRVYLPEIFLQRLQKEKYLKEPEGISQRLIEDIETFVGNYFDRVQTVMIDKGFKLQNTQPSIMTGFLSKLVSNNAGVAIIFPYNSQYGEFLIEVVSV